MPLRPARCPASPGRGRRARWRRGGPAPGALRGRWRPRPSPLVVLELRPPPSRRQPVLLAARAVPAGAVLARPPTCGWRPCRTTSCSPGRCVRGRMPWAAASGLASPPGEALTASRPGAPRPRRRPARAGGWPCTSSRPTRPRSTSWPRASGRGSTPWPGAPPLALAAKVLATDPPDTAARPARPSAARARCRALAVCGRGRRRARRARFARGSGDGLGRGAREAARPRGRRPRVAPRGIRPRP